MTDSIHRDRHGPDWPLGFIAVATPGTPVGFMVNVDPNAYDAPETLSAPQSAEYTVRAYEIIVHAQKPGAAHGTQVNAGNVYILRRGVGGGTGNRDDRGSMITPLYPGQTLFLTAAALNLDVWNPYRYFVDADNAGDGVIVVLVVQ